MDKIIKECVKTFNLHLMFTTLLNFCSNDLSAFYFDIRKDVIYCDGKKSIERRSSRTLLDIIFNYLVRWFAPSLSFTTEEAWKSRNNNSSIHLEDFLITPESYKNSEVNDIWITLKQIRKVITGALEKKRADKIIGSSLEAHIDIYLEKSILEKVKNYQLDEISITSSFELHEITSNSEGFSLEEVSDVKVEVSKTSGQKCQRCWKYKKQLIRDEICSRCDNAIS
jgi:isoleucyl-tRNA synthetase